MSRLSIGGPTVLLADDEPSVRELYRSYLVAVGCTVVTATDGGDVVGKAETLGPDVIVMDLSMPCVDGWAATKRLKQSGATKHIPVIAMSGVNDRARETARRAGCDAFVAKPCLPDLLWWHIREILANRSQQ